jgi:DNA phosphorothioation-associated putative methyltransferase
MAIPSPVTDPAAHRTAIARGRLSRPIRIALESGLLKERETVFDYGCGRGGDIAGLRKMGFEASGWDPYYQPGQRITDADIINIGYVINVIPDLRERQEALFQAWRCAKKALVVSARLKAELRTMPVGRPCGDGFITERGTFQRFFDQVELREWIDATLDVNSVAAAPGIFIVFRADEDANKFLLRNRSRRPMVVSVSRSHRMYDEHRELLDRLMSFFSERGRLPVPGENPELEDDLHAAIGSVRRAWSLIEKMTGEADWSSIVSARTADLLDD